MKIHPIPKTIAFLLFLIGCALILRGATFAANNNMFTSILSSAFGIGFIISSFVLNRNNKSK